MSTSQKSQLDTLMVVNLPYQADPDKNEEWEAATRPKYSKEDWDREFGLKPAGHKDSYPVFGDWRRDHHECKDIEFNPKLEVICGWDFGKVHPCVEFFQIDGTHYRFFYEFYGNNIYLPQVCMTVNVQLGKLGHPRATHWVDATGKNDNFEHRNHLKVLKENGIAPVRYRYEADIEPPIGVMQQLINTFHDGYPCLTANPIACPHFCEAMRGGYKRDKRGKPMKDGIHDHPVDAARYGIWGTWQNNSLHLDKHQAKAKVYRYKPKNRWTGY
jgi:hypothetical protein